MKVPSQPTSSEKPTDAGQLKPTRVDTDLLELGDRKIYWPQKVAVSRRGMISTAHYRATEAGVEILEAEDGDQAMAFLHQEYPHVDAPQPDLIFLSNHLPDRTGPEIIKELQQDRRLRTIPVALFSEEDPTASRNVTFPDNCHLFMRPKTCDEWIYVLRCIEDVWITLLNMAGKPRL